MKVSDLRRRRKRKLLCFLRTSVFVSAVSPLLVMSFVRSRNKLDNKASSSESTNWPSTLHSQKESHQKAKRKDHVPVVAYVVTLTECNSKLGKISATSTWQRDGILQNSAAVFRRSVELATYPLHPRARYGHKLYVIMNAAAQRNSNERCAKEFRKLGYTVLERNLPVRNPLGHLTRTFPNMEKKFPGTKFPPRPIIEDDGCCGEQELLKLRLYELIEHPVVVHLDLDALLLQPLDELFDVIALPHNTPQGKAARRHLFDQKLIDPAYFGESNRSLPEQIDAFYTKDWTSTKRKFSKWAGVQGGFLVARPSLDVYQDYRRIIQEGNYTLGRGAGSGYGSAGYGRQIEGSMTFQGLTPYYYDVVNRTGVELHRCKFNQMAGNPRESKGARYPRPTPLDPDLFDFRDGNCRDGRDNCDDVQCQTWPMEEVRSAHFTFCLKPWDCPDFAIWNNTLVEHTCRNLHRAWFRIRHDLEQSEKRGESNGGSFEPEEFLGYCRKSGPDGYIPLSPV